MTGPVASLSAALVLGALLTGCDRRRDGTLLPPVEQGASGVRRDEPPVPLGPESPVGYPAALFQQRLSGTVLLRLFVDETGKVVSESTRVQESSGYPAFDSAAMAGAPRMRYAPALRNGVPVAALFTQPVHFRHPDRGGTTP